MTITVNLSVELPDEVGKFPLLALIDHLTKSDNEVLSDNLMKAQAENEALKARLAELEAENTPPEGCEGWQRSRVWISPLAPGGLHKIRWADGRQFSDNSWIAKGYHGVTFPENK